MVATSTMKSNDWADDDYENGLPATQVTQGPDGVKTVVEYRMEDGKKVKVVRKIKVILRREKVNHDVAERKRWAKFGAEAGNRPGPDVRTTTLGEDVPLRLQFGYKANQQQEEEAGGAKDKLKERIKGTTISCRSCGGEHWTSQCPYKETLGSLDELLNGGSGTASPAAGRAGSPTPESMAAAAGGAGGASGGGRYLPPHLRGTGRVPSLSMMGSDMKRERNDEATLRVTNLSEFVTEDDLRELFRRFGGVQRIYLAKDRETNLAKGFAFVSYYDRSAAEMAQAKMDGFGFDNLIMRCEFSKSRD